MDYITSTQPYGFKVATESYSDANALNSAGAKVEQAEMAHEGGGRIQEEIKSVPERSTGPVADKSQVSINGEKSDADENTQYSAEKLEMLDKFKARDREVRAHEAAHAAVGGQYAGAYSYQRGSDGRNYAIGGQVSIDVAPVPNDPQATIQKMDIVRRATLAPAKPSNKDRQVAQEALVAKQKAQVELRKEKAAEETAANESEKTSEESEDELVANPAETTDLNPPSTGQLAL